MLFVYIVLITTTIFHNSVTAIINNTLQSQEYYFLGNHYEYINNKKEAKNNYIKAITVDDANAQAHAKLGLFSYEENNISNAITHFTVGLSYQPKDAFMHFNLGKCYIQQKAWYPAHSALQKATQYNSNNAAAYIQLAFVCEQINRDQDAIDAYRKAIFIDPNYFEAYCRLGNILRKTNQLREAANAYQKALILQPHNKHIMIELANTLNMLMDYQQALNLYDKILSGDSIIISVLYNKGFTLKKMGKFKQALSIYREIISKYPQYALAHFSLAFIYLSFGDFKNGWKEYEWRWQAYNEKLRRFNKPSWNSENLSHRTLFVYAEQGLGDTLQFIRYLKVLKEKYTNIRIIFETQEPLHVLLQQQPYIDLVISRGQNIPPFDFHIPLMSLPYALQTELDTIPTPIPYIESSETLIIEWNKKLAVDTNLKVGLCWQGNAQYRSHALQSVVALKSIPLDQFAPLFEIPHVSFYSLQKIDGTDQIATSLLKDSLISFDASFDQLHGRFMDTAAIIKNFDLIITVDTSIAHLAGAIGTPVWLLLPEPADWRWLLGRTDSPWYPSMRLFRQQIPGIWKPVIASMALDLFYLANNKQKENDWKYNAITNHHPSNDQLLFFEQLLNSF